MFANWNYKIVYSKTKAEQYHGDKSTAVSISTETTAANQAQMDIKLLAAWKNSAILWLFIYSFNKLM